MKAPRQLAFLLVVSSLFAPEMAALAAPGTVNDGSSSHYPIQISQGQSLPPIQSNGYSTPTYSNTYGQPAYTPPTAYNQPPSYNQQQPMYNQTPLQGYVVSAPAGTVVSTNLSSPVSSEYARVGDRVNATLGAPIASGSNIILPAGSQLEGQVVMTKPAGRTGKNGELEVRFTAATTPNGQRIPLSARIQTEDGTGVIKGGSTGGRVGRAAVTTGVGAGLGAALGTAMGPLSGGGVGKGAIYGTVLGAGMGALGSAIQKGKPAVLETGQPINIVLDQPLTTSPNSNFGAPSYNQGGGDSAYQYYQPGGNAPQNPQPYNFYGNGGQ